MCNRKMVFVLAVLIGFLVIAPNANAGLIDNITVTTADKTLGATGVTYTVTARFANPIPPDGQIIFWFESVSYSSEFDLNNAYIQCPAGHDTGATMVSSFNYGVYNTLALTLDSVSSPVSAGSTYTFTIENVTNPSDSGLFYLVVYTYDASGNPLDGDTMGDVPLYRSPPIYIGQVTATGVVTDNLGNPLPYAEVWIHTTDFTYQEWFYTESDGVYFFTNQAPGQQLVIDVAPPWNRGDLQPTAPYFFTVPPAASPPHSKNFALAAGTKTISGSLKWANGSPVTNAQIWVERVDGFGGVGPITPDAGGNYSAKVGGGVWFVEVEDTGAPRFADLGKGEDIFFKMDTTVESAVVNKVVVPADAFVMGTIRAPDGTAPPLYSIEVNISNSDGTFWMHIDVLSDGTFSEYIPAGKYKVEFFVWVEPDLSGAQPDWGPPQMASYLFSVSAGGTKNFGTLTMTKRTDRIQGKLTTSSGTPLGFMHVICQEQEGPDFSETLTDSNGNYSLYAFPRKYIVLPTGWYVPGGVWAPKKAAEAPTRRSNVVRESMVKTEKPLEQEVGPELSDYVLQGGPRFITVYSGVISYVNFTMIPANSTIRGKVVDSSGNVLTSLYGFLGAENPNVENLGPNAIFGLGGPVENGFFNFKVPAGTYELFLGLPPGASYSASSTKTVTVTSGGTAEIEIVALANDAVIQGRFLDVDGNQITNISADVFAGSESGGFQPGQVDVANGTYRIEISRGTWHVGFFIDPEQYSYIPHPMTDNSVTISSGQTVTKDLVFYTANSTISGTVKDPDGNAMPFTFVAVHKYFADGDSGVVKEGGEEMFMNGTETDESGVYTLKVPPGQYTVGTFAPPELGYLNPPIQVVTVGGSSPATVNLQFKLPDATISGTISKDGVPGPEGAFVSAWSDTGGYAEYEVGSNGAYELKVGKNSNWRIRAVYETEDAVYESSPCGEDVIVGSESSVTKNLPLVLAEDLSKPQSVTVTFSATQSKLIQLADGARLNIPARAISSDTAATITITATPKMEVGRQKNNMPLSGGYEFTALVDGQEVTSFNSSVTIFIPYDPQRLADAGITTEDLIPTYWDENSGAWRKVDNVTINKETNEVIISVDHFTTFSVNSTAALAFDTVSTTVGDGLTNNYGGGGSGCFLATSAFEKVGGTQTVTNFTGTYLTSGKNLKKLNTLRKFRDEDLMKTSTGRKMVRAYYTLGPVAAEAIRGNEPLKRTVRDLILNPLSK